VTTRRVKYDRAIASGAGRGGKSGADFRQAIDIEDASRAVNQINCRKKRDRYEAKEENRPKPSMPKMPWDKS
jgi:hypothetical protein